jgi:hypothetical protein
MPDGLGPYGPAGFIPERLLEDYSDTATVESNDGTIAVLHYQRARQNETLRRPDGISSNEFKEVLPVGASYQCAFDNPDYEFTSPPTHNDGAECEARSESTTLGVEESG